jgi:hypothetical protein
MSRTRPHEWLESHLRLWPAVYTDTYSYGNSNSDRNTYRDCYSNRDGDNHSHADSYAKSDTDSKTDTNSAASPHPTASPVAYAYENKTRWSMWVFEPIHLNWPGSLLCWSPFGAFGHGNAAIVDAYAHT